MTPSENCIAFIRSFEGLELKAYPDPATGGEPITIGYGSTKYEDGTKVKLGESITPARAEFMLRKSVYATAKQMAPFIKSGVNQNQFDALTSFAYNCGIGNLVKSTLLIKVNKDPNDVTISNEFLKWNKAAGKVMNGLTKRRTAEALLYAKN